VTIERDAVEIVELRAENKRLNEKLFALLEILASEVNSDVEKAEKLATRAPWRQGHHVDEPCAIVAESDPRDSLLGLDRDGMAIFFNEHDAMLAVRGRNLLAKLIEAAARFKP
jgi:hypothetical protein